MRLFASVFLVMLTVVPAGSALAATGQAATYVSGSLQETKPGTAGTLDMTAPATLDFHMSDGGQFSIPFAAIGNYEYREESKFHLGVLPAIAVALVKKRAKVHFVTMSWKGNRGATEVATLEMSKTAANGLMSLLRVRVPGTCGQKGMAIAPCRWSAPRSAAH